MTELFSKNRLSFSNWLLIVTVSSGIFLVATAQNLHSADAPASTQSDAVTSVWRPGQEYIYTWVYGDRKVGSTRFSVHDLEDEKTKKAPGNPVRFRVAATFDYRRDSTTMKIERTQHFDTEWRLLHYETTTYLSHAENAMSTQQARGWRDGKALHLEVQHNDKKQSGTRSLLKLDRPADVVLPHTVEIWAFLMARKGKGKTIEDMRLAFPDFRRFYNVSFKGAGVESLKLASGDSVECRRFDFRSEAKEIVGKVWVAADGRLIRYQQGPLRVQYTPAKKKTTKPVSAL